jgi:hypothetical protein
MVVVRTEAEVLSLVGSLVGDRQRPVIVLTQASESALAVLPPKQVRAAVGPDVDIYLIAGDGLAGSLGEALGRALGVAPGMARVFWPGLSCRSDPSDHPLVPVLDGESQDGALAELVRQFNLSRPDVRQEIRLIEDARSVLQDQLARLESDIRKLTQQIRTANHQRDEALRSTHPCARRPTHRNPGEAP